MTDTPAFDQLESTPPVWANDEARAVFEHLQNQIKEHMTPPNWARSNESYAQWHREAWEATQVIRKEAMHVFNLFTTPGPIIIRTKP